MSGLVGNFVHVLQVITIDADIMEYYDVICEGTGSVLISRIYMAVLGVLHLAMPVVSALSAFTVLFRCFSSVQLFFVNKFKRPMFVFSELNECSLRLAEDLKKMNGDIVFLGSDDETMSSDDESKRGFIFKEESIADFKVKTKKGKDVYLFCINEDEDLSLSYSLQLIEKLSALDEESQTHIHIYQFSKHKDYSVFIDSVDNCSLDVQCVNECEMLIYKLLDRYPLYKFVKSDIHVLLHGLSYINATVLRAVAWCGQLGGFNMKISVVGVDIGDEIEELRLQVPGLFSDRYCINFYDCRSEAEIVDVISEKCADANYIVVSDESDNDTMNKGIILRRLFYRLGDNYDNCPPIFCYIKDTAKFNIVRNLTTAEANPARKTSYNLTPFGSLDEIYTYKNLIASPLEGLARNVHLAYEEIFSDGEIDVSAALKRYNIFEVNKRSNRANALHIRYKLNLLGLDYVEESDSPTVSPEDFLHEENMQLLEVAEHDRWMAFLETEGWIPSTKEDVEAYRASGLSKGRHNCPLLKMHPYICEYEKLRDLSLALEGKDTTVYDRELILRIPDILGDKWNVSGKKYKIIKLETNNQEE